MLPPEDAQRFAAEWIDAWNSHDIERILSHWDEDCVFTSPMAAKLIGGTGTVRCKSALREYWTRGLAASPGLRFTLKGALLGQDSLVIFYENHRAQSCAEWLQLNAALEGAAHYACER